LIPDHADIGLREQALLQDLLAPQAVAAMHQRDVAREVRQVQRFLGRGIAAADHGDILAAEEEAVTGGAGGDAEARQLLLTRNAEPAGLGAGGDHQRVRQVDRAAIPRRAEGPAREVDVEDHILLDRRADMFGLGLHLFHQPGALDRLGEAGVVLDIGGDGQLAARLHAGDDQRREPRARGVDRRRVAGRAGADDEKLGLSGIGHGSVASAIRQGFHILQARPRLNRPWAGAGWVFTAIAVVWT
jgi:hypothetical protein